MVLTVDDEGVVRVVASEDETLELAPDDLARLLTQIVSALVAGDESIDVELDDRLDG